MTPIKENRRYDIISTSEVPTYEELPEHFLGDTPEEAEKLHNEFSGLLNKMSLNYALTTGLEKSFLFGEALIGLARAKRDFDPKRSNDFKSFVIRKVKDALNECVKDNSSIVTVPRYLKDTNRNIKALEYATGEKADRILENIHKAAERAGITPEELIIRAASIPEDVEYNEFVESNTSVPKEDENKLNNVMLIMKLKQYMNDTERKIADLIMEDKTYEAIGKEFGHTASWVTKKVQKMREKLIKYL